VRGPLEKYPVGDTSKMRNASLLWAIQRFEPPGKCGSDTKWRFHGHTLSPSQHR
jgi:hypothetical protein